MCTVHSCVMVLPVPSLLSPPIQQDDGITSEEWGEWLKVGHNLWHSDVSDVVRVQSGKSPEVISTTAEVLRRHGCEEESTLLAGRQSRPSFIYQLFECVERLGDKLVHTVCALIFTRFIFVDL